MRRANPLAEEVRKKREEEEEDRLFEPIKDDKKYLSVVVSALVSSKVLKGKHKFCHQLLATMARTDDPAQIVAWLHQRFSYPLVDDKLMCPGIDIKQLLEAAATRAEIEAAIRYRAKQGSRLASSDGS